MYEMTFISNTLINNAFLNNICILHGPSIQFKKTVCANTDKHWLFPCNKSMTMSIKLHIILSWLMLNMRKLITCQKFLDFRSLFRKKVKRIILYFNVILSKISMCHTMTRLCAWRKVNNIFKFYKNGLNLKKFRAWEIR